MLYGWVTNYGRHCEVAGHRAGKGRSRLYALSTVVAAVSRDPRLNCYLRLAVCTQSTDSFELAVIGKVIGAF
jgi:hypothetical protein